MSQFERTDDPPRDLVRPIALVANVGGPSTWSMHMHKAAEVGVVIRGQLETRFRGATVVCGPGDTWLCAMWEAHAWRFAKLSTQVVVLNFLPEAVDDTILGDQAWMRVFSLPATDRQRLQSGKRRHRMRRLAMQLHEDVVEHPACGQALKLAGLYRLLVEVLSCSPRSHEGLGIREPGTGDCVRIMPALRLIDEAVARRISLSEAANACNLSRSHFRLLFKGAMGLGFGQFALRTRVGRAAHRLAATDLAVDVIARELGFEDGSHLHRAFVAHCGCTPGEYRMQHVLPPEPRYLRDVALVALGSLTTLMPSSDLRYQHARASIHVARHPHRW